MVFRWWVAGLKGNSSVKSLRALAYFMRPYWVPALLAPLLMALEVAMDLAQPRLLQTVVDVGIAKHDLRLVYHMGLLMMGAAVVGLIGGAGCSYFAVIAGLRFATDIRGAVFRQIQELSFSNLDRLQTGRLITRLTNDVDQVQEAALMFMRILVRAPLTVVGSFVMAVLTDPRLSLLIVAISPLLLVTFTITSRKGHQLFLTVQDRLDRLNIVLQENLAGVRVVKAFVRAARECQRFGAANEQLRAATVRASTLMAGVMPMMMLLVNLGVVAVIWFGGWQVFRGEGHVGQVLAFVNYLTQMLGSLMMVGMLVMRVAQADASAQRILEVLRTTPDVLDPPQPVPAPPAQGRVEFENVTFSYDGGDGEPVLRGVSFTAEPGEMVAIVGATGAGKSTLVHLIPRLYDVTAGAVRVDGVDVRQMRQDDLRARVGLVMQDAVLFSGTVADNIRLGRPDATQQEVEDAARIAQAHDFICALPDGYDTVLGQRGVNLSGGQKQRLAIARALVCKPSVLILDDCTSAVDAETEARIMQALQNPEHRCTRLVVAQRIGSILRADRVLVLEDGMIAASGTHEELLRTSSIYQEIVRSQLVGQEVGHV
jgi:ATP-binding cassette subfamily B protein